MDTPFDFIQFNTNASVTVIPTTTILTAARIP